MGNCHGVMQLEPHFIPEGAAILVRPEFTHEFRARFEEEPSASYLLIQETNTTFTISNVNVDSCTFTDPASTKLYLVIQSGGKWGYGDDMVEKVRALAPMLEDSVWLLDDEYTGYVQRWEIKDGHLNEPEWVVGKDSSVTEYVLSSVDLPPDKLSQLYLYLGEQDLTHAWDDSEDVDRGVAQLQKAKELGADANLVNLKLAWGLAKNGRYKEALALCDDALAPVEQEYTEEFAARKRIWPAQSTLVQLFSQRAFSLSNLGRHEEALESYHKAICLGGSSALTWGNICWSHIKLGQLEEAKGAGLEAIRGRSPAGLHNAISNLGLAEFLLGNKETSLSYLQMYIEATQNVYLANKRRQELRETEEFAPLQKHPEFIALTKHVDPKK